MQEELATLREELVETRAEGNLSAAFLLTLFPGDADLAFSRNVLGDFEELFRLRQKSPLLFEVRKMDFWGKVAEIEGKLKAHLEGQGETKNISCGPTDPTSGVVSDERLDWQSL
jgi:hypothetical protein